MSALSVVIKSVYYIDEISREKAFPVIHDAINILTITVSDENRMLVINSFRYDMPHKCAWLS